MRRAAKVDRNHGEIVDALRQVGATVQSLAQIGNGCPDLLVGWRGKNWLLEVKLGKGRLRPLQVNWLLCWNGQKAVVWTPEQALAAIGASVNHADTV